MIQELGITDAQTKMYGTMMPERVFQELLKVGFAAFKQDPSLIDELFHKLDRPTREDMKAYFLGRTVDIRLNFPVDGITFPMITIINSSDSEEAGSDLMGDFMGGEFDEGLTTSIQTVGHACQSSFSLYCLGGKDANVPLWLYYLAKAIIVANGLTIDAQGLHNIVFGGQDISVREDLFPEKTYARLLTIQCLNWFSVKITERVANRISVALFTEDPESGTKMQLNVEAP